MAEAPQNSRQSLKSALLMGSAAIIGFHYAEYLRGYQEYHLIRAVLALMILASVMKLSAAALRFAAKMLAWHYANQSSGLKGTAGWADWREIKRQCSRRMNGVFLGAVRHRGRLQPVVADFQSNALCIAPAGTGKGIYTVVNTILMIGHAKLIIDFKGELSCLCKPALEARGEEVVVINFADLWTDVLGQSAYFNPLMLIVDLLWAAGGLKDVSDDCQELAMQLYPEPSKGGDDNLYFRNGSRKDLTFAIIFVCLVYDREATLGEVAQFLNDRERLLTSLQMVCGELVLQGDGDPETRKAPPLAIEDAPWIGEHDALDAANFIAWFRALAAGLLNLMISADSRTFESFLAGAQQAVDRFNITTRVHEITSKSTVDLNDLKRADKIVNIFVVIDASRLEAQKQALGLIQWCAALVIKRHEAKHRPVYLISDEATNFKLQELHSLLTWGRGYGLRHFLCFQDGSAFIKVYGEECFETLLSETEIKQFLPGQRSQKILDLIVKLLGEQSVMAAGYSGNQKRFRDIGGHDLREEARSLMTPDEIRRCDKAINIVRTARPFLTEPISFAEIAPFRRQVGINPFHGKRFLKRIKLRLWRKMNWRLWHGL